VTEQLSLLTEPRARGNDPGTSHAAAAAVSASAGYTQFLIMGAFDAHGDLTDDELCQALQAEWWPTVKSARSRLTKAGLLVRTGETRKSVRGVDQIVWRAA
jgi:hypothetical protein